ncbi:helix-turn-helix transcriptional regulator [Mucilaginibacter rubeus]|uniref:Helix-turn-helix transcriptional regulator n=1 Tax=Mucilaginibacter rubeus TaxID=2027860 RepID=A0AAE6JE93_9SPHI|nr:MULTISPECIES: helix-turn-helix transcriptional regulator [Mucilaginibacter]QEM03955.1 helix-turn-helix transcriptional regulator [Mucilaginibacter rubeus]QEM16564.1 helix-turn-helix transcriptional regulator [Mucilaginibacter gossypii]QTE40666.1 helix-turn-helix transcriptional regulator [Mucilaginibacter rubeus]QTE47268.1 helix-turn-helix transcriptional regulator [Mucilaginibacter rubeus]QTE58661.1 helix-turn-helix transcriptional regulator [Mucilaginibacter rubeus]
MEDIVRFETVKSYNDFNNEETLHPLVSVIDFSKASPRNRYKMYFGLYVVILKDVDCGDLTYGRANYDYQEGTLVFFSPGQVAGVRKEELFQPSGHALVLHPDFIRGTSLGRHIQDYGFFSCNVNEALHLSQRERQIVLDSFSKIRYELEHAIDKHSRKLVISTVELFLNYCVRFYDRQFITREDIHKGILEKFETLLYNYFRSDNLQNTGLPTVGYCADSLHLSSNYFGELIKKETGKSAHDFIQEKVIDLAKEKIFDRNKSVSEIAYELGFRYPQHFTRLFKQKTGTTPLEYRSQN